MTADLLSPSIVLLHCIAPNFAKVSLSWECFQNFSKLRGDSSELIGFDGSFSWN